MPATNPTSAWFQGPSGGAPSKSSGTTVAFPSPGRPGWTTMLDGVEVGSGSSVHAETPSTTPTTTNPQVRKRVPAPVLVIGLTFPPGKLRMRSVPSV